ncbi:sigma 54-interacting transcriptional regulator [Thalassotalea atypica]|uniref:sigma 54-interacting transcriptional regulator n=1 Tax=Thalassotalea atypica TaxID=2054316 RepID=UPI0025724F8C|nr:sigma 54-interacting transcriptional regulator [Thalassotalea atypica]
MRIQISSTDRVGISQEILSVIAENKWNIVAMEIIPKTIFLHVESQKITFSKVAQALKKVKGVLGCNPIDLLPTESREQHLNAMLSRIPDPIFDVDRNGVVISCNLNNAPIQKDNETFQDKLSIIGQNISELFAVNQEILVTPKRNALEVNFNGQLYLAESTPVIFEGKLNGVVIILKGMDAIGRQISMMQRSDAHQVDNIIGTSAKISLLKNQLLKFSTLDLPILLTGETGTGKELFARAIHEASGRKGAPFLAINCASLSEHLLESELFGYMAGAFTGAQKSGKPGLFELAHGGTVFLDEIAEMSGYLQAKLLRFLQDYSYRRLGGTKELTANVRIISASHQPFDLMIQNKVFREDLYYRLNVLSLSLPALKERNEDIPLLCHHFMKNAAKQVNQVVPLLTESALAQLIEYSWPGNIRQLQNVLFRLVALNTSNEISEEDVQKVLADFGAPVAKQILENVEEKSGGQHWLKVEDWQSAQYQFEHELLSQFKPVYTSTRKLAQRLKVSHNKIAMKLRQHKLNEG